MSDKDDGYKAGKSGSTGLPEVVMRMVRNSEYNKGYEEGAQAKKAEEEKDKK